MKRIAVFWLVVGVIGWALLPWYLTEGGFWRFGWLADMSGTNISALGAASSANLPWAKIAYISKRIHGACADFSSHLFLNCKTG